MPKSLIEIAYECVKSSQEPLAFNDIWKYVKENAGLSDDKADEKVSRFYTNLLLDGRFVMLGDNMWDLRVRHLYDKVHIDMNDVYSDVETSDLDEEDEEEEKEYNGAFEEKKESDSYYDEESEENI